MTDGYMQQSVNSIYYENEIY